MNKLLRNAPLFFYCEVCRNQRELHLCKRIDDKHIECDICRSKHYIPSDWDVKETE